MVNQNLTAKFLNILLNQMSFKFTFELLSILQRNFYWMEKEYFQVDLKDLASIIDHGVSGLSSNSHLLVMYFSKNYKFDFKLITIS